MARSTSSMTGSSAGSLDLDDAIFGIEPNVSVMHQVVVAQLAARRKAPSPPRPAPRSVVAVAKPWKQKGTGNARAGLDPLTAVAWRRRGPRPEAPQVRAAHPQEDEALALALGAVGPPADNKVIVVDAWDFDTPSTKAAKAALTARRATGAGARRARPVTTNWPPARASATSPRCTLHRTPVSSTTYDVLVNDFVVFTRPRCPVRPRQPPLQEATSVKDPATSSSDRWCRRSPTASSRGCLHLHRGPGCQQARDPRRGRGHLGRLGRQGQHAQPQGQAHPQPRKRMTYGSRPDTKRAIVTLAEGDDDRPVRG
jgi:large subunit ribosomal protein L4